MKYWFLCLIALAAMSCKSDEQTYMDDLTDGFWVPVTDDVKYMIRFGHSGGVGYYDYRSADGGNYDITLMSGGNFPDSYVIDISNSRICMLPYDWYDVLVLTSRVLTLSDTTGTNYKFFNVDGDHVVILSSDRFYQKYPHPKK